MKKKLLLLTATFLISSSSGTITAQKNVPKAVKSEVATVIKKSPVTTTMARKIGYYCRHNQRALSLFAIANPQQVRNRTDLAHRLLETLDKHLDCAENFIVTLYYNYGVEMAYFALKDAGFTIKETDIAEAIYQKEREKQYRIAQEQEVRKNAERERILLKRIESNYIFDKESLLIQPNVEIDISAMATSSITNNRDEYIDYSYDCIIDKEGKLSLTNLSDTLHYSDMQKFIYQYICDENVGSGIYTPGYVKIGNDTVAGKCYINIKFNEQRYQHKGYLDLTVVKDKKTGQWRFIEDLNSKLQNWTCREPEILRYDLETAIYNCPSLDELNKNKVELKFYVYSRKLRSNISDEIDLSHYFKILYLKRGFWETGYTPLEYKISF